MAAYHDKSDHFAVLGISANASKDEIKQAYRRLAHQYHPDLHPDNPMADDMMKTLNAAYAALIREPVGAAAQSPVEHTLFDNRCRGHDVTAQVIVKPAEARLGVWRTLRYHNPAGQPYAISIWIPPGAVMGLRLRIPGKGGPGRGNGSAGDLYVVITICE